MNQGSETDKERAKDKGNEPLSDGLHGHGLKHMGELYGFPEIMTAEIKGLRNKNSSR